LALTAVLLARLGRHSGAVPRWIHATAWATAATLLLGVSVALLVPFAAWAIALGIAWRSHGSPTPATSTPVTEGRSS
jgi:hypothetical protein